MSSSKRSLATYVLGAGFVALAVGALTTGSLLLFGLSIAFQVAMFLPGWGGKK